MAGTSHNITPEELEKLKYPIGKVQFETEYSHSKIQTIITKIETQADALRTLIKTIGEADLKYSYRPGGWCIRQIIHHIPDSSVNAYIRTKLALTENTPTIKPYDENKWAEMPDNNADIKISVELLDATHKRWTNLLRHIQPEDFNREFYHPEMKRNVPLTQHLSIYAWHGHHHIAQIKIALEKKF